MKHKYCPYCDQKMTTPCYCKGCHRIVLHPYEQEIDYFLNERHPEHEENCLYHGDQGGEDTFMDRLMPVLEKAKEKRIQRKVKITKKRS